MTSKDAEKNAQQHEQEKNAEQPDLSRYEFSWGHFFRSLGLTIGIAITLYLIARFVFGIKL